MTLRDVRTGDVHEVRERAGSRQVKAGELYCARVVRAGDTMQIFGGIQPVSIGERDDLIALLDDDPNPVELVATLSRRFAPPVLQNTEGESLMMCDATLRVGDPAALTEALNDEYDRDDGEPDGALVWFEHVITHGMQRIRAHLELTSTPTARPASSACWPRSARWTRRCCARPANPRRRRASRRASIGPDRPGAEAVEQ